MRCDMMTAATVVVPVTTAGMYRAQVFSIFSLRSRLRPASTSATMRTRDASKDAFAARTAVVTVPTAPKAVSKAGALAFAIFRPDWNMSRKITTELLNLVEQFGVLAGLDDVSDKGFA